VREALIDAKPCWKSYAPHISWADAVHAALSIKICASRATTPTSKLLKCLYCRG